MWEEIVAYTSYLADVSLYSFQEVRELLDLQRNYFLLLHAMTTQELSSVMLSQQSSPLLQNIIGLLLDASCNHKDVLVRKVSR